MTKTASRRSHRFGLDGLRCGQRAHVDAPLRPGWSRITLEFSNKVFTVAGWVFNALLAVAVVWMVIR